MKSTLLNRILILLIPLILAGACKLNAQQGVLTNEAIIHSLIIPGALEIITPHVSAGDTVSIESDGSPMAIWAAKILTDSCVSRNYFVYSPATREGNSGKRIVLSDASTDISYTPAGRKWLLFAASPERRITAIMRLLLEDPERILVSRSIGGNYSDRISSGAIVKAESPRLLFTQGTKIRDTIIKRWVEPVILTAATATVIYLFFSLRSNN